MSDPSRRSEQTHETDRERVTVVQVFFVVSSRGGERVAGLLARGFAARGHETRSVGVYRRGPANADTAGYLILSPARPGPLGAVRVWVRLVRELRRTRPRAVLLHTQVAGLLGATAAIVARVPVRVNIHHTNLGVSGRYFPRIEAIAGSLGLYTDIVFVGHGLRSQVDGFPARYRRRARVITNAVDVPPSADRAAVRARYGIPDDELVVLAAGALDEQKNHQVLVRAMGAVPEARLVIAGEGPMRARLEALAAEHGTRLHLLGQVSPDEVLELGAAADLYVMPSRVEGRSLALLDAVSAGLPVVLSDIAQNVEVMGDAARYCGPDDAACWSRCLAELLRDPDALAALRTACRAHDIGTVDAMVDAYLALVTRTG